MKNSTNNKTAASNIRIEEFLPLPVGARVISASPVAVTVRYRGNVTRWFGVTNFLGQSQEWNREHNAVVCEVRDRIHAAVESGAIVLGQPIAADSIV